MQKTLLILKKAAALSIGALALILIVAAMSGAFHEKTPTDKLQRAKRVLPKDAPTTTTLQVEQTLIEEAIGSVIAARRTAVSSRILATINNISVRSGDHVQAGEILVTLDDRDLQARVDQALREKEATQALLIDAQGEFNRQKEMLAKKVTPQSAYDRAESAFLAAEARLAQAESGINEAKITLSYASIRSPVSGRVIDRLSEPGNTASPGQPLLQLYDPKDLQLEAAVRESLASTLKTGDALRVRIDALDQTLEGQIREIVPQSEIGSRVFRVKIALPQNERVYTGMFGRAMIPVGHRSMILLPEKAVEAIGQNRFVEVVGKGRILSRRLITLGARQKDARVEVLSGLKPGEEVALQE